MKKSNFMSMIMLVAIMTPLLISCGGSDEVDDVKNETSQASAEYLCSTLLWVYAPEKGINNGEFYYNYSFYNIAGADGCTITAGSESNDSELSGYYDVTYSFPSVHLKERNSIGYNNKGRSVTLTVYKYTEKGSNSKYLLINGKRYISSIGDGIYQK